MPRPEVGLERIDIVARSELVRDCVVLRDRIAALQLVECRMAHERLRREQGRLVRIDRGEPEPVLARRGLCSAEVREQRLACGHTMARYLLHRALRVLRLAGELGEREHGELEQALGGLGDQVHLLDHRKGEAERRSGLLAEGLSLSERPSAAARMALEAAAAEVRALEQEHEGYVRELGVWRERILRHLDLVIGRGRPDPPE
jgi:hypothetical protein